MLVSHQIVIDRAVCDCDPVKCHVGLGSYSNGTYTAYLTCSGCGIRVELPGKKVGSLKLVIQSQEPVDKKEEKLAHSDRYIVKQDEL